jgi:hypothetical protein
MPPVTTSHEPSAPHSAVSWSPPSNARALAPDPSSSSTPSPSPASSGSSSTGKEHPSSKAPSRPKRIAGSIRSGLRYVRYSPTLQSSLLRAFVFTFFVSGIWSLLAVVAQRDLHQGALGYGLLNGSLGVGAVIAATQLPRIRRRATADQILTVSTIYQSATLLILAFVRSPYLIIPALVLSGFAWTSTMSTLNVSVQLAVPAWVQARALGSYLMTFQGGLALGSILWGFLAEHTSTPIALTVAGLGLLITLPLVWRFHILQGPLPDLTPYQWPRPAPEIAPLPGAEADLTEGPVRISIEYHVPLERYVEFTHVIHELRGVRLRDGAIRWGIYRNASNPEILNETFLMESWLDYLRSRERVTAADRIIRDRVYALHTGDEPPVVSHQIYVRELTPDLATT